MCLQPTHMQASLQMLKAKRDTMLVNSHDLAIDQHGPVQTLRESCEGVDDLRELLGLVVTETRVDRDTDLGCATHIDERPHAVVFGLKDEVGLGQDSFVGRGVGQLGEHRADVAGRTPPARGTA